jgi:hypothetical protein
MSIHPSAILLGQRVAVVGASLGGILPYDSLLPCRLKFCMPWHAMMTSCVYDDGAIFFIEFVLMQGLPLQMFFHSLEL